MSRLGGLGLVFSMGCSPHWSVAWSCTVNDYQTVRNSSTAGTITIGGGCDDNGQDGVTVALGVRETGDEAN